MDVLDLMLLLSYLSFGSPFISIQFHVLNLDGSFVVSSNRFIIFWYSIILLYYYILLCQSSFNFRSSTAFFLSFGYIHFFLRTSSFVSELFCGEVFKTLAILSAILFLIKSPVASAVFWIALCYTVLSASIADCLPWSTIFWLYLPLEFLFIYLPIFLLIFLAKDKNP